MRTPSGRFIVSDSEAQYNKRRTKARHAYRSSVIEHAEAYASGEALAVEAEQGEWRVSEGAMQAARDFDARHLTLSGTTRCCIGELDIAPHMVSTPATKGFDDSVATVRRNRYFLRERLLAPKAVTVEPKRRKRYKPKKPTWHLEPSWWKIRQEHTGELYGVECHPHLSHMQHMHSGVRVPPTPLTHAAHALWCESATHASHMPHTYSKRPTSTAPLTHPNRASLSHHP